MLKLWIKKYLPTLAAATIFAAIGWVFSLIIASFGEKASYDILFNLGLPILVAGIIFGMMRNPIGRRGIKRMEERKKKEQEQQKAEGKKKKEAQCSAGEEFAKLMFSTPVVILGGIFLLVLSVATSL